MIIDRLTFNIDLEKFVIETGESYIDAIVHYCNKHQLEIEVIPKLLNKVIRSKIEAEASSLNLLKEKLCQLPV
jgi:hypothetical protein|tara:strand:- start:1772 stop:1990 length:219 start_codon:yes stop_codon:yes gene_type:complete